VIKDGKISGPAGEVGEFNELATQACYQRGGSVIVGKGNFVPHNVRIADKNTTYGNISPSYCFECQVAEVEVDLETGAVSLVNFYASHDLGKVINPNCAEGVLEGGIGNSVGFALTEESKWDQEGRMINADFKDYRLPTALDVPKIKIDLIEPVDPIGPFGAKSIAEAATVPTAAAIANAIYNATGVRPTQLPITPERMLKIIEKNC
ncbi:MAG: molybdopterin-dependent oxidoreductase, partial [Firmicutes bacterium]|nr:molybdopterin-dependent oxidoreductase [Bacillota bacterium]